MKKLTILCSALLLAATTVFAEISYQLPEGAVTNEYGWLNADDMFAAFMTDAGCTGFQTLAEYKALSDPLGGTGICGKLNNPDVAFADTAKWGWFKTYMEEASAAQRADDASVSVLPENGAGGAWRYAIGAFFVDGQRETWPRSANFNAVGAGTYAAYADTWKHAYCNPTEVAEGETFTLNAPYKEGETFRGWFDNEGGSGDPITTIDHNTTGTLYALFGEYIPNVGEVLALADSTDTKVTGTVTYVAGSNFWIQDANGGLLCYGKNHGLVAGELVVLQGQKVTYKGSPELNGATVISHVAGELPAIKTATIAQVCTENYGNMLNQLVSFTNVTITKYVQGGSGDNTFYTPYIGEGANEIAVYKYDNPLTEAVYPVGTRVNIAKAVLSIYNDQLQLRGDGNDIEAVAAAVRDTYEYPARGENGDYTLTNNWLYSTTLDNFADNRPGSTADGFVRGMVAFGGKMYFIDRSNSRLFVVDGATGNPLDPIALTGEHLFQKQDTTDGSWVGATTLPFNDIKLDNAGNVLIGACTMGTQQFMIYKVNIETGACDLILNDRVMDNPEIAAAFEGKTIRFDAFGVTGDVDSHAIIMAQDANSMNAFKWVIDNGVAAPAEQISLYVDSSESSYLLECATVDDATVCDMIANPGSAPQIFPVDDNYFYLDGNLTLPTLFNMDGTLADDFKNCFAGIRLANNEGDTCILNQGHNGLLEFQIGDEYFLVMAATNTVGKPNSAFALYKYADAGKSFATMEPLWFFPNAGMGSHTNGFRTAVPSVEVNGNVATIYLYTGDNGYGVYTFTAPEITAVENVMDDTVKVEKRMENGVLYIIKNGVKYNVLGARVK